MIEKSQICSKCKTKKILNNDNFTWRKDQNKFRTDCKKCVNEKQLQNRNKPENKKKALDYGKKWRENNKEYLNNYFNDPLVKEKQKRYKEINKEIISEKSKIYRNKPEIIEKTKIYYLNNREKIIEATKLYKKNNIRKYGGKYYKEKAREWYLNNRERILEESKEKHILKTYGLTLEQKQKMLEQQNYKCIISNLPLTNLTEACIDHCHKTNKVRGLLSKNINFGLGCFEDNILLLEKTIEYLQNTQHQEKINQIIQSNRWLYNQIDENWSIREINQNEKLKNKYRISLWDYYNILKLQNNKCIISNKTQFLHLDHCHKTNKIRGIIHEKYNIGLGHFNDNVVWINNAIKYVYKYC